MDKNTSIYSEESAFWKCPKCNYEWSETIKNLNSQQLHCPFCERHTAIWSGKNDALTLCPDLIELLDPEDPNNSQISSVDVTSKKEFTWKCPECGKKWSSPLAKRIKIKADGTIQAIGCSDCGYKIRKITELVEKYPILTEMYRNDLNPTPLASIYGTTALKQIKYYWICPDCGETFNKQIHSLIQSLNNHTTGCPYCSCTLLRKGESFADYHPDLIEEYAPENTINPFEVFPSSKKMVKWICHNSPTHTWTASFSLRHNGGGNCPYCNHTYVIHNYNSLATIYPDIISSWSINNLRSPEQVFYDSSEYFLWICPDCNREYSAQINKMVSGAADCPYCNDRLAIPGETSLLALYPELANYYSPNNYSDSDHVLTTRSTDYLWICPKCNKEYSAQINKMVSGEADCPYCNDRIIIPGFNSFAAKHPDLLKEWDYINNYLILDPDTVSDSNSTPVWWICQNKTETKNQKIITHYYPTSIKSRLIFQKRHREPCPYCRGLRVKKRYFV